MWLLVLTLHWAPEARESRVYGLMVNEVTCNFVGQVMADRGMNDVPGMVVTWSCTPGGEPA